MSSIDRFQPARRCASASTWSACNVCTVCCTADSSAVVRSSKACEAACRDPPSSVAAPSSAWQTPRCCNAACSPASSHCAASRPAMPSMDWLQSARRCSSAALWAACAVSTVSCSALSSAVVRCSTACVMEASAPSSRAACWSCVCAWRCWACVQVSATCRVVPSHWAVRASRCTPVASRSRWCERSASCASVAMACSTTGRIVSPAMRALAPRLSCSDAPTVVASWV